MNVIDQIVKLSRGSHPSVVETLMPTAAKSSKGRSRLGCDKAHQTMHPHWKSVSLQQIHKHMKMIRHHYEGRYLDVSTSNEEPE